MQQPVPLTGPCPQLPPPKQANLEVLIDESLQSVCILISDYQDLIGMVNPHHQMQQVLSGMPIDLLSSIYQE